MYASMDDVDSNRQLVSSQVATEMLPKYNAIHLTLRLISTGQRERLRSVPRTLQCDLQLVECDLHLQDSNLPLEHPRRLRGAPY